jgi:EAL domain-containing protein (putative c-di-GMP-specific phosphodiesterase class I)
VRDLPCAFRRGELHLVFQPIVSMDDHEPLGMEALIRWAHPTLGVLLPMRFIRLAEEIDLIGEIGLWVLDEALNQLVVCRRVEGMENLTVSVNLSPFQLRDELLVPRIGRLLSRHGLAGSALNLEIAESATITDPEAVVEALNSLKSLGVRLTVDDFGTEYLSLAYLHRWPVDSLKLHRGLIEALGDNHSSSASLLAAILGMSCALGVHPIAVGVETSEHARTLVDLGYDIAQGYLYARPARADQIIDVLNLLSAGPHAGGATLDACDLAPALAGRRG